MAKKIITALLITILASSSVFGQRGRQSGNRNLRENKAITLFGVNGVYKQNGAENTALGVGISVTNLYDWVHFGCSVDYVSNGTFSGKFYIGPNIWFGNFFGGLSLDLGMAQCLRTETYLNTNNLDVFRLRTPAPKMTVGASIRCGFVFDRIGIHGKVSYDNANGYKRGVLLQNPWELTERNESENIITAELGISFVLGDNSVRYSGDNCFEFATYAGTSSYGVFFGSELLKFERLGYAMGQSYGGFASFYYGNGNAEIGGKYMLNWYPGGSNSVYTGSLGAELAMGQYKRLWNGAADDPERFNVRGGNYAFGGRISVLIEPVALQLGQFKVSAFGSIGYAAWLPVKATGNLGLETASVNSGLYWNLGGKLSIAL